MKRATLLLWVPLLFGIQTVIGQISPDCSEAIPICNNTPVNGGTNDYGIDDFNGAAKSGCLETSLSGFIEDNSAWYKFRTSAAGQLGFNISFDASEDWDFALYKAIDCASLGEPVRCNFFDNRDDLTHMGVGVDPTGTVESLLYDDWLDVTAGEDYYILINNYSNSNSGFSIQFSGSIFESNPSNALDCSIITNLLGPPLIACDNEDVILDATKTEALQYEWFSDTGSGFMAISGQTGPTLNVNLSAFYRVKVSTPSEIIFSDVQIGFTTAPTTFVVADEAICSELVFFDLFQKDQEALGNQSGSDFAVSYHSAIADAVDGVGALSKEYPIKAGMETIYVRTTSLANSQCFDVSQQFKLKVLQNPEITFSTELFLCENSTSVVIGELNANASYTYSWGSGATTSNIQVDEGGTYVLTMTYEENGFSCERIVPITVVISKIPAITDVIIEDVQNNNTVTVITDVEGQFEYQLDDGPFQVGNIFSNVLPGGHVLTINDLNGCGSVSESIVVVGFPKFFTPNGDPFNNEWKIVGIETLQDPVVFIYDRYGKLLQQMTKDSMGWNGEVNGKSLPSSDYWFKLTYIDARGQRATAKYIESHFSLKR
ncbi:T9SS type B sorting domain-containing protein [Sediminicola arcticus]|jgi:gliding motility-associated-like protein|uniref:T9SS type B sorting domain-containing protein n=1 Tax=Sediminicola arcticus TaxID=1574308 RepID=A0ABV2SS79_9FLAO